MNNKPLVSVCIQTYNHSNYIAECLDGVLKQKTTFDFEIILGEDESSDGTREICIDYAQKYPEKIKLFLRSRKDVVYINGQPTGRYNFLENLKACTGKYITLCPGDDYWTDPLKLQKQVDFLEENKEYSSCAHAVEVLYEYPYSRKIHFTEKKLETIQEVASLFYPTCSVVFRKNILGKAEFELFQTGTSGGDKILQYICFKHGKSHFINEKMGCYRKNMGGVSYNRIPSRKSIVGEKKLYSLLNKYFTGAHNKYFTRLMLISQIKINQTLKQEKKPLLFIFGIIKGLKYLRSIKNLKLLLKDSFTKI